MVGSVDELQQPVAAVTYTGVSGEDAGHNIYLFDQAIAKLGVGYFAEYRQGIGRTALFTIYVPEEQAGAVASLAARLHKR
jgi:hypothetical protein